MRKLKGHLVDGWEGNYHVDFHTETETVEIHKINGELFPEDLEEKDPADNVLLYLGRDNMKRGFDRQLMHGLSAYRGLNVAVATNPEIVYAERAQIVIPRLGSGLELNLRDTYDGKLILGSDELRKIDSYDAFKELVPKWIKMVRDLSLEEAA